MRECTGKFIGERVLLRRFLITDINIAYLNWLNDPVMVRFSNQRFATHNMESAKAYLATFDGNANLFYSIRRKKDDLAIGTMTAYVDRNHETADLGILIGDPEVAGKGYGSEAWDLLLTALLSRPDIRKVTCGTISCNRAMQTIAERCGMEPDGVRRGQQLIKGQPVDVLHYARFRS